MQQRPCPALGRAISVLGFGGIVLSGRPQDECDREVAEEVDRGFTYFDVAPQYGDSQQRMGPALRPFRDRVILNCKTLERGGAAATAELEDSLRKLRTDRFDVYQLHAMSTAEDVDRALAPGGALEALEDAQRAGKCRALGFSAHDEEAALALIATGRFATMLLPLNAVMFERGVFGPRALAAANDAGMTTFALKAMARGRAEGGGGGGAGGAYPKCWYEVEDRAPVAGLALRYTLGLPGVVSALPPGQPALFHLAAEGADRAGGPTTPRSRPRSTPTSGPACSTPWPAASHSSPKPPDGVPPTRGAGRGRGRGRGETAEVHRRRRRGLIAPPKVAGRSARHRMVAPAARERHVLLTARTNRTVRNPLKQGKTPEIFPGERAT